MKSAATFLLLIGCIWALFVLWLFLAVAGVADRPQSWGKPLFYWGGMLFGPLVLNVGATFVLSGRFVRQGALLVYLGCGILSCFALYSSLNGIQRKPLQAPAPFGLYAGLLLVMLLVDAAAYRIYRELDGLK